MSKSYKGFFKYILIILGLVAVDLATKSLFFHLYGNGGELPIIGDFLKLTYVENTGASFGSLKGQSVLLTIVSIFGTILFSFLLFRLRKDNWWTRASLTMVIAGTIGNLYDRLFYQYVRDFISVKYFAIFNFADSCIVVGIIIFCLMLIFNKQTQALLFGEDEKHPKDSSKK